MDSKSLFEILIRENTEMVIAYIRSGVRDAHAVDDLYQETVLTAWRRLDDYDNAKAFGPWLRGIAGRLMLAYYRKSSRGEKTIDDQTLLWLNDRFDAIHQQRGDTLHEKLAALRDCVEALPENYGRPIRMRYAEDRTLGEIRDALSLAAETLKKRLTRAKSRLANCLERKLGLGEAG